MKKRWQRWAWFFGLLVLVDVAFGQHGPDWPDWAYGVLEPLSPQSRLAPPCPAGSRPFDCAFVEAPVPDDGLKRRLPDTDQTFTRNEAYFDYGPADWYPADHPLMPDIVASGKQSIKFRACALCHYPNGQGRTENAHVAGLPEQYILQQLDAFVAGTRRSADRRKANTNEMAMIAASLNDEERKQAAAYFASMPYRKMVRVVETTEIPQVRTTSNGLMTPMEQLPRVPLGKRIIMVPENPERTLMSRDPRGQWIAYVPVGSVAAGEKLVITGGGKTLYCSLCHGPGLKGIADIPPLGGRTATYVMRQLWDFKQGTRQSQLMQSVVENLNAEDMLFISAYLASLQP